MKKPARAGFLSDTVHCVQKKGVGGSGVICARWGDLCCVTEFQFFAAMGVHRRNGGAHFQKLKENNTTIKYNKITYCMQLG